MVKNPQEELRPIGKVAEMLELKPYVIRYWESQFEELAPRRRGNRRLYSESDINLLRGLKNLLHDVGMTTGAVREILEDKGVDHVAGFDKAIGDPPVSGNVDPQSSSTVATRLEAFGTWHEFRMPAPSAIDDATRKRLEELLRRLTAIRDRASSESGQAHAESDGL